MMLSARNVMIWSLCYWNMEQISPLPITTASMLSTMQPSEAIQGKTCAKFFSRQHTNFFFILYVNNTCNQFLIWFCYFMFETVSSQTASWYYTVGKFHYYSCVYYKCIFILNNINYSTKWCYLHFTRNFASCLIKKLLLSHGFLNPDNF